MSKPVSFIISMAFAAACGTIAFAPEKIPHVITGTTVRARIERLDREALPFARRINALHEDIRRPVDFSYRTTAEKERELLKLDTERKNLKAELAEAKRQSEDICNDPVLGRPGKTYEFVFDNNYYEFPDNLKTVCGQKGVLLSTFFPVHIWRALFGITALVLAAGALKDLMKSGNADGKTESD